MHILHGFFLLKEFSKRLLSFTNLNMLKVVAIPGFQEFGLIEMKIHSPTNDH